MSELSEAINEMRNMRESYDQIGAAAEAYNTGKTELAANINAKGVQASASETLPELAEKVSAIAQESYTIDGGEMYAKQLFGSLETPNYWNLYNILAQLLSDGRLVSYGGILLAEYYRGYDSLALAGAGAGGAYVVSDKDENGQFKMYTEDTTHTWATEFDGHGNRWVAYCFADEYHDFQITDTNTSPRSIFIGRKVGIINLLTNSRTSQVVVPDGNELKGISSGTFTQNWGRSIVLRNIGHLSGTAIYLNNANTESIYIKLLSFVSGGLINSNTPTIPSIIIDGENADFSQAGGKNAESTLFYGLDKICTNFILKAGREYFGQITGNGGYGRLVNAYIYCNKLVSQQGYYMISNAAVGTHCKLYLYDLEETGNVSPANKLCVIAGGFDYAYIGYKDNDKTKEVRLKQSSISRCTDIELQDGYCKPLDISAFSNALTKENVQAHIFDKLGVNDPSTGAVTLTLATDVLNLFTQEEIDAVVARTNITIVGA